MAEEGRVRRKALKERLKAKRRAKETELEKKGAGEKERCDQNMNLNRLEELEAEVSKVDGQRETIRLAYAPVFGAAETLVFKVIADMLEVFQKIHVDTIQTFLVSSLSLPSRFLGLCEPIQALDEKLNTEREARLKEVRACAAAAEEAATLANSRAAGGAEVDPTAAFTSSKMKVREKSPKLKAIEG